MVQAHRRSDTTQSKPTSKHDQTITTITRLISSYEKWRDPFAETSELLETVPELLGSLGTVVSAVEEADKVRRALWKERWLRTGLSESESFGKADVEVPRESTWMELDEVVHLAFAWVRLHVLHLAREGWNISSSNPKLGYAATYSNAYLRFDQSEDFKNPDAQLPFFLKLLTSNNLAEYVSARVCLEKAITRNNRKLVTSAIEDTLYAIDNKEGSNSTAREHQRIAGLANRTIKWLQKARETIDTANGALLAAVPLLRTIEIDGASRGRPLLPERLSTNHSPKPQKISGAEKAASKPANPQPSSLSHRQATVRPQSAPAPAPAPATNPDLSKKKARKPEGQRPLDKVPTGSKEVSEGSETTTRTKALFPSETKAASPNPIPQPGKINPPVSKPRAIPPSSIPEPRFEAPVPPVPEIMAEIAAPLASTSKPTISKRKRSEGGDVELPPAKKGRVGQAAVTRFASIPSTSNPPVPAPEDSDRPDKPREKLVVSSGRPALQKTTKAPLKRSGKVRKDFDLANLILPPKGTFTVPPKPSTKPQLPEARKEASTTSSAQTTVRPAPLPKSMGSKATGAKSRPVSRPSMSFEPPKPSEEQLPAEIMRRLKQGRTSDAHKACWWVEWVGEEVEEKTEQRRQSAGKRKSVEMKRSLLETTVSRVESLAAGEELQGPWVPDTFDKSVISSYQRPRHTPSPLAPARSPSHRPSSVLAIANAQLPPDSPNESTSPYPRRIPAPTFFSSGQNTGSAPVAGPSVSIKVALRAKEKPVVSSGDVPVPSCSSETWRKKIERTAPVSSMSDPGIPDQRSSPRRKYFYSNFVSPASKVKADSDEESMGVHDRVISETTDLLSSEAEEMYGLL